MQFECFAFLEKNICKAFGMQAHTYEISLCVSARAFFFSSNVRSQKSATNNKHKYGC